MINCKGKIIDFTSPKIMGILNITPDSFFDGGKYMDDKKDLKHVDKMIEEGVDIIDIGAISTRPGATWLNEKEELSRLIPVLQKIRKKYPQLVISIDTFRGSIAKAAIEEGADIINDIFAGTYDGDMVNVISYYKVPYIIMHMQGTPQDMQKAPQYKNIIKELLIFFGERIETLKKAGIPDIIIDPGIGFGKTLAHNYTLIHNLEIFTHLGCPILLGVSRKSLIYKALDITPKEALNGTTVLHTVALNKGVHILRVHDVKEAVEARKICELINNNVLH